MPCRRGTTGRVRARAAWKARARRAAAAGRPCPSSPPAAATCRAAGPCRSPRAWRPGRRRAPGVGLQETSPELAQAVVAGPNWSLSATHGTSCRWGFGIRCSRCAIQAYRSSAMALCDRAASARSSSGTAWRCRLSKYIGDRETVDGQSARCRSSWKPQVEPATMWVDLPAISATMAKRICAARRVSWSLMMPMLRPCGVEPEPLHEGGQAGLDLDLGRAGAHGLGVEMGQDQARLRPERQADLHPSAVGLGHRRPGCAVRRGPVRVPIPAPPRRGRGRAGGLAEDRVLEGDLGVAVAQQLGRVEQALLHQGLLLRHPQQLARRFRWHPGSLLSGRHDPGDWQTCPRLTWVRFPRRTLGRSGTAHFGSQTSN